jgi:WD40 repeat protein
MKISGDGKVLAIWVDIKTGENSIEMCKLFDLKTLKLIHEEPLDLED